MTEPRWFAHPVTKPGHLMERSEAVEEPRTCDRPENVAVCMSCPLDRCVHDSPHKGICPIVQNRHKGKVGRPRKYEALDAKILDALNAGWNELPLCRELGISPEELRRAKVRIRQRGGRA